MKTISPALLAHIQKSSTTLAYCWKVTRTDGAIFGFTSTDRHLDIDGVRYFAKTGFTPSAIKSNADLSVANLEVMGMLDSASITEEDINAGLWDFAKIQIFQVNYRDLSMGILKESSGTMGEIRSGVISFSAEVRGLAQQLQQNIGELCSPTCRADFGDSSCKVDLIPLTVTGSVTSVSSTKLFSDSSRTESPDYFNHGKFTFTSGLNQGISREVRSFDSGQFSLYIDMPYQISVSDTYEVYPGCLKRFNEDCRDRWANAINFQGEPDVPGNDQMLAIGGQ